MSYQDRKDIDNLYDLIWDFDKNQTQFASREEFEEFKKYVKINYSMSALTEAIASNMDENGLIIFENLQDGLNELETNLDGLQDNLTDLSGQLNGDATHTGFINLLTELQHKMYGEGDYDGNGDPYTYTNPSSNSLKGLLDALRGSLGELSAGDTQLAVTLSDLKSKLVGFSGTLTQFRNQIRQELGETAYEQLNQDLLELIFNIANANDKIDDHQDRIQATENLIGTEEDSASEQDGSAQNPYTVFGILNDTSDLAGDVNDSANGLLDLMYRGTGNDYNPNADPEHPADNTTLQWLGDTSQTANTVKNNVGDVSKFTEATISEALKNRADGLTAINNKLGNTAFTGNTLTGAIASLQTNIGTVNIGSLANTVSGIGRNIGNTDISELVSTVGSIDSNIGNTDISELESTTNRIDGIIGDTDVQGLASTVGNTSFTGASLTGAIASMQTQIGTVNINGSVTNAINSLQTSIGNVNLLGGSSVSVALYNSILNIGDVTLFNGESLSLALGNAQVFLKAIMNSFPVIMTVTSDESKDDVNGFECPYVYEEETGKYYKWETY